MENIGKKLVEKYCIYQQYGEWTIYEEELINAINEEIEKAKTK